MALGPEAQSEDPWAAFPEAPAQEPVRAEPEAPVRAQAEDPWAAYPEASEPVRARAEDAAQPKTEQPLGFIDRLRQGLRERALEGPSYGKPVRDVVESGQFGAGAREFARNIIPTTAGVLGAVAAAPLGAPAGLIGGLATGFLGATAASTAAEKAQDWALKQFGVDPALGAALDAEAYPWTTRIAGAAPALLSMTPSTAGRQLIGGVAPKVSALAERAISGGFMGGIEAAQEAVTTGEVDPRSIATSAAVGALAPRTRGWTAPVEQAGARLAGKVWPHSAAGPEAAAGVSQEPKPTAGEPVSFEAGKPVQQNEAIRSEREYGKGAPPAAEGGGVNQVNLDPAVAAALGETQAPRAAEVTAPVAPASQPLSIQDIARVADDLRERNVAPHISEIVKATGRPVEEVHAALMREAQAGNITLHPSTVAEANLPPGVTEAGMAVPGHPEPLTQFTVKPRAPVEPTVQPPVEPTVQPPASSSSLQSPPPTPPTGGPISPALQNVIDRVATPKKQRTLPTLDELYTWVVNELHPVGKFVHKVTGGAPVPVAKDPYAQMRLVKASPGKIDELLRTGVRDPVTGQKMGDGLLETLRPLTDPADLQKLDAYMRSQHTLDLAQRRGIKTGIDLADAQQVVTQLHQQFDPIAQKVRKFGDDVLDYAVKRGLYSQEQVDAMRAANPLYSSLAREMDFDTTGGVAPGVQAYDPIHGLKGSERMFKPMLQSILKNTFDIISNADRAHALMTLEDLVGKHQGYMSSMLEPVVGPRLPGQRLKPNEVNIIRDGKDRIFKFREEDLPVVNAIKAADNESLNFALRILSAPAKWLRAGATLAPEFGLRNIFRDQLTAMGNSRYGYVPFWDFARNLGKVIGKDDLYQQWKADGGAQAALVSLDRDYIAQNARRLINPTTGERIKNVVRSPIEVLRRISEVAEETTRLGEYRRGIEKGATGQEAAFAARDLLDYARMGSKMRAVNALVPFFNAQIQGIDAAARAFQRNPTGFLTKMAMGITTPSLLLWFNNHDDPRYKELSRWEKDLYWIIPTDNWKNITAAQAKLLSPSMVRQVGSQWQRNDGTIYKIPKPFELGILFGTVPERLMDAFFGANPQAFKDLPKTLLQAFLPSFIPQFATPVIEQFANHSMFLDRDLVSKNLQELQPWAQIKEGTTQVARALGSAFTEFNKRAGKLLPETLGSPIIIDNYIRQWTGGLGTHVNNIIDFSLKASGMVPSKIEPTGTLADMPLIKAFVVRYPNSQTQSVKDFYDTYEERKAAKATEAYLRKRGDRTAAQVIRENGALDAAEGVKTALGRQFKAVRDIYADPKMTSDQKRDAIDQIYLQMIPIAQRGLQQFEKTRYRQRTNKSAEPTYAK